MTGTEVWSRIEMTVVESRLMTDYATVTRYPGDYEPVSRDEAGHAIELAERVRAAERRELGGHADPSRLRGRASHPPPPGV